MTNDTAYMLLTCSRDKSRYETMKKVIENLRLHPQFEDFNKNLVVFDNSSTFEDSRHILLENFNNVVLAEDNYGYWDAINWFVNNHADVLEREYEYMYLIESDQTHYDWYKFDVVEKLMNVTLDVSSTRMREFFVEEAHLYDKERQSEDSRRWAWTTQRNPFTGEKVHFTVIDEQRQYYLTNFTTIPPSMNRVNLMKHAFGKLAQMKSFIETDFARTCYEAAPVVGLINGGVCHAKLGYGKEVVSSHNTSEAAFNALGYKWCGQSKSLSLANVKVQVVKKA